MKKRYRVLLPLVVNYQGGRYEWGEEFEAEFSDEDEASHLASGLLAIMPESNPQGDSA